MKSLVIYSILLLLFSCQTDSEKRLNEVESAKENLNALILKESNKSETFNGMFDIPLNIPATIFNKKIDSLVQKAELFKNGQEYHYFFDVKIPFETSVKATYKPQFLNDTLYQIAIIFESPTIQNGIPSLTLNDGIARSVQSLYFEKYGSYGSDNFISIPSLLDSAYNVNDYWIKGNTEIHAFKNDNEPLIVFYNYIPTKKRVERSSIIVNDEKESKIKKAI